MTSRDVRLACLALAIALGSAAGCAHLGGQDPKDGDPALLERIEQARAARVRTEVEEAPETVESRLTRGDALRDAGDASRALWQYLQAHRMDPEDPRPTVRIAGLHLSREPQRAEAIFRDLVARHEGNASALTGLGLALVAQGRFAEAIPELEAAVERGPRLGAAHNALGVALEQVGRQDEARDRYRRAAELQPRSHEPLNNLGVSFLASGELEQAVHALEQATRRERNDPALWNNLGLALGRQRRYGEALDAFRRAGGEAAALNNLGYVQHLNGDHAEALASYERALLAGGDADLRREVLRNLRAARSAQGEEGVGTPPAAPTD